MTVCRDLARHRGAGTKHENDQRKSDKDEQSCHYQLLDEKRPGNMSTVRFSHHETGPWTGFTAVPPGQNHTLKEEIIASRDPINPLYSNAQLMRRLKSQLKPARRVQLSPDSWSML